MALPDPASPSEESGDAAGAATAPETASAHPSATASRTPSPTPSATRSASATPSATPSPADTPTRPPSSYAPQQGGRPGSQGLAVGSSGPAVTDLQNRLQELRLYAGTADGVFSQAVADALSRYQIARGVPGERGVYGPATRAALGAETHGGN
ncbi:hypothetical protein BU197_19440 [Streptomyces sp. CBMA291]|nr:hypothetical protein [Streptomyces sp. CBMA291]MBD0712811.1 hypothetical protein [Streptomyces sp. CBMA370]